MWGGSAVGMWRGGPREQVWGAGEIRGRSGRVIDSAARSSPGGRSPTSNGRAVLPDRRGQAPPTIRRLPFYHIHSSNESHPHAAALHTYKPPARFCTTAVQCLTTRHRSIRPVRASVPAGNTSASNRNRSVSGRNKGNATFMKGPASMQG